MTFKEVQIGQTFYTHNGKPSKKINSTTAISLVPELSGFDFQEAINDVTFEYPECRHIYGVGEAKGHRA
tara:strand:- start:262 stop:468 length:207 start_codon:yes stop_codon:yes gene_type:complete